MSLTKAVEGIPLIEPTSIFDHEEPEVLFRGYPIIRQGGRDYDTDDGQRFVMMKAVEDTSVSARIIVVENWFVELRRLAPAE